MVWEFPYSLQREGAIAIFNFLNIEEGAFLSTVLLLKVTQKCF
jgi:hypothetical protein